MAYNQVERFPVSSVYYPLLDPGTYCTNDSIKRVGAKEVGFLSNAPRQTTTTGKLWTHALYSAYYGHKIPNITSLMSRQPRFPYESFGKEDLERILCQCGINTECECDTKVDEEEQDILCQGKVKKKIYIGPSPRVQRNIEKTQSFDYRTNIPFYDARVNESTAFYQGCKWSRWTSKRSQKSGEVRPGPADYDYSPKLTESQLCIEKLRALRRKTSKQLRFIELVQRRNMIEGRPGPATYSPKLPMGPELKFLGSKAERFTSSEYDVKPGPTQYDVKRDFDLPPPLQKLCVAKLPEKACFGVKASRFKHRISEGPSPANYNANVKLCQFTHCPTCAFGSSTKRFKETEIVSSDEEDEEEDEENSQNKCPNYTWQFKSKTILSKPYVKKFNEPSPADLAPPALKEKRPLKLQYISPFLTSEGRFEPWNDWMPVHCKMKTPGPAYYNLEKPRCFPAVKCGPLFRSRRFPQNNNLNPAPNEYKIPKGIENICQTYNEKLKLNVIKKEKIHNNIKWVSKSTVPKLSHEEQLSHIIDKSITLLNGLHGEENLNEEMPRKSKINSDKTKQTKLLRCFLHSREVSKC